jgi:hypothetical protein
LALIGDLESWWQNIKKYLDYETGYPIKTRIY